MTTTMTPMRQMMEVELVQDTRLKMLMESWLRSETSRDEDAELLRAGCLKQINVQGDRLAITAKGWELAHPRRPRHVSEAPATYTVEQKPSWCPKCQRFQHPFKFEPNCRNCGAPLVALHSADSKCLDAYGRFAREVQMAVEEADGYDDLKQRLRKSTMDLHDKLLRVGGIISERPADVYAADDDERGGKLAPGTSIVAMCPKCNDTNIGEQNVAFALLDVTGWEMGTDGHPTPATFDGDNTAEWMTADEKDPYECRSCGWKGDLDDLNYSVKPEDVE